MTGERQFPAVPPHDLAIAAPWVLTRADGTAQGASWSANG